MSKKHRLSRLLDTTSLARIVPRLAPETLHQLIRHRGLEACGELVTAATPAQLTSVLDLDLWDRNDRFDAARFGDWLEMLVDTGDSVAARTVSALDPDLVVSGLCRYVRVFDPGIFEPTAQSDDEPGDRHEAMREGDSIFAGAARADGASELPECEVGGYLVRARRADAWDAIVTLLVALDEEHGDFFHTVVRGCLRLSDSRPECDGLDELLLAPEQLLHDVGIERERRRSQQGYTTTADARAFLDMARQPQRSRARDGSAGPTPVNPIVAAYFRSADEVQESVRESASPSDDVPPAKGDAESVEAVLELLTDAGVMPERPRALLHAAEADTQAHRLSRLRRLLAYVRDADELAYAARTRELAFLANTFLAGCSVQSRPFTPQEASDAAAATCNLGLEHWPMLWLRVPETTRRDRPLPDNLLIDHDLVTAFEVGWSVLHRHVSLPAADELISTLTGLAGVDRDMRRDLVALRHTLAKERAAGTPWRARGAAEILAPLDTTASIGVLGLLDECPVLPAALTAVLEGRKTRVSPTEFEFISSADQISVVRDFVRRLPGLLTTASDPRDRAPAARSAAGRSRPGSPR